MRAAVECWIDAECGGFEYHERVTKLDASEPVLYWAAPDLARRNPLVVDQLGRALLRMAPLLGVEFRETESRSAARLVIRMEEDRECKSEQVGGHIGWIVGGAIGACVGYQHTLRIAVPKRLNEYAAGLFLYEEACIVASRALRGAGESQQVIAYADYLVLMAASMRARAIERLAGRQHEVSDWYRSGARGWPQRPSGRKHEISCPAMTYIRIAYDDALNPISAADALESGDELADRAFDIAKSADKDYDGSVVNHIYARLAFERSKETLTTFVKYPLTLAKVEVHDQTLKQIVTDVKLADNDVRVTMLAAGVEPPKYPAFDLESLEAIYSLELI